MRYSVCITITLIQCRSLAFYCVQMTFSKLNMGQLGFFKFYFKKKKKGKGEEKRRGLRRPCRLVAFGSSHTSGNANQGRALAEPPSPLVYKSSFDSLLSIAVDSPPVSSGAGSPSDSNIILWNYWEGSCLLPRVPRGSPGSDCLPLSQLPASGWNWSAGWYARGKNCSKAVNFQHRYFWS